MVDPSAGMPKSKVPGKHDHIWQQLHDALPWQKTPEQLAKRKKLWKSFDVDGTGVLSLAKVDKGMRDAVDLPMLFNLEPVEIRAFNAAIKRASKKNKYSADFVEPQDFRYLLKYLRVYYELWVAFESMDDTGEHRITKSEFLANKD